VLAAGGRRRGVGRSGVGAAAETGAEHRQPQEEAGGGHQQRRHGGRRLHRRTAALAAVLADVLGQVQAGHDLKKNPKMGSIFSENVGQTRQSAVNLQIIP